ncbi:hypothetical protein LZZ50_03995 [Xanthomonas arboricola]|uniref:hypothetical protein n=1 Tax=Xanthomonas arboricola TaxID=56448 RepID=UPI001FD69763|nr:hypothetical protein [Xanthomonas arboricola]MEB1609345.1 hypothetical protein [Xanthomonas campestris pv. campestris]UOS99547.1 hypothetical protein LZZ50_03995 [Xanthomonas arboricola]
MHAELEDWKNGWHGLRLSLLPQEISRLIELLQDLQQDPEQHFHISSDYSAESGLGDIEISIATDSEQHNMSLSGLALAPSTDKPALGA